MSRNSKNAKRIQQAREMSKTRTGGGSGPSSTSPKHGKKKAWWQVGNGSYTAFIKGDGKKKRGGDAEVVNAGVV